MATSAAIGLKAASGLSVKILAVARTGWRSGRVLSTGAVALDPTNEVVPPSRIRAIVHHPREQTPHEVPDPKEIGYLVLLGAIFFEGKHTDSRKRAWPSWRMSRNGVLRAATTLSGVLAIAVTGTSVPLAVAG